MLPHLLEDQRTQVFPRPRREGHALELARGGLDLEGGHLREVAEGLADRLGRGLDLGHHTAVLAEAAFQILDPVGRHDAPLVEHQHPGAGHLDLAEDVRRQQHRVRPAQLLDERAHGPQLVGIETDGGLIEDDQIGLVHQRVGQPDTLPIALGQLSDDALLDVLESALLDHPVDALPAATDPQALEPGAELEVVADPHVDVQRVVLGHVADAAAHLVGLVEHVEPRDADGAARRRHERRQDAHGRRFAGAIRPEEPDHLPAAHREGNPIDRRASGVSLREVRDLDHGSGVRHPPWSREN